nr:protein TsetseEP-like [Dermacentor andersoni]
MIPVVVLLLMALVAFVVLTFAFDADLFANKTIGLLYPASGARGAYPLENQTSTVGSSLIPATKDVKNVQNATPTPMTTTATTPSAVLWPFPKREPWPMPDPGPWPLPGPNPWPMPEPKPRPMPEPNPGSDSEPEPWTVTDPAPWPMTEPKPWPMPEPHPRPMSEPDPFPMTVPKPPPMPEPNPGPMSEQTSWPMTQPTSSPMPQPASLPLPGRDPRPKTKRPLSTMPAQDPSHMSSSQSRYPIMQRNNLFDNPAHTLSNIDINSDLSEEKQKVLRELCLRGSGGVLGVVSIASLETLELRETAGVRVSGLSCWGEVLLAADCSAGGPCFWNGRAAFAASAEEADGLASGFAWAVAEFRCDVLPLCNT